MWTGVANLKVNWLQFSGKYFSSSSQCQYLKQEIVPLFPWKGGFISNSPLNWRYSLRDLLLLDSTLCPVHPARCKLTLGPLYSTKASSIDHVHHWVPTSICWLDSSISSFLVSTWMHSKCLFWKKKFFYRLDVCMFVCIYYECAHICIYVFV